MNVKYFRKLLAAFAAAAVAVGGGGVQPLSTLLGTVASAWDYDTNTGGFKYINRRWDDTSKQVIREEVNYGGKYTTLSYLNGLPTDHIVLFGLPEYANQVETNWYVASESLTLKSAQWKKPGKKTPPTAARFITSRPRSPRGALQTP